MRAAPTPPVERRVPRRGAFGLDERRRPDPRRIEAVLRAHLGGRHPDIWAVDGPAAGDTATDPSGCTLALLLPRGRVAMLRIERDPERPGAGALALAERCRIMRIPHATVSSVEGGRAALRRLGIEPRPGSPSTAVPTDRPAAGRPLPERGA